LEEIKVQVGYLGPKGTFSEEAAIRYYSNQEIERIPFMNFWDILEAIQTKKINQGILPIENSIEGSVNSVLDGLQHYSDLFINGEMVLNVEQNLLVHNGTQLKDLKQIWSHPQPLAQCRQFIQSLSVETRTFGSTAQAAEELFQTKDPTVGVLGPAWTAKRLGLTLLKANIQDFEENHTRFITIGRGLDVTDTAKTTFLLVTPEKEQPGVLVNILNVFASLNLNLTWIESRPTKKRLGDYQFFIKISEGLKNAHMEKAINVLQLYGHTVHVLGSF
jgi:prephenate dehydratase